MLTPLDTPPGSPSNDELTPRLDGTYINSKTVLGYVPSSLLRSEIIAKIQCTEIAVDFICEYAEGIANGLNPSIALAEYKDKQGLKNMTSTQEKYILGQFSDLETHRPNTSQQQIPTPDKFDVNFLLEVAETFQTQYIEEINEYVVQKNVYPRPELATDLDLFDSGLDPGLALTEFREKMGIDEFSPAEVAFILGQLQLPKRNVVVVNDTEIKPMPSRPMMGEDAPGTEPELHKRVDFPDPISISMSANDPLSASPSSATILGDMADNQNPSQKQGFTADLFGLEMPTEIAKKLGFSIGLPDHHVRKRIRSSTPHRATFRRSPYLSETAMAPPKKEKKRKASPTVQQGRRTSPLKTMLHNETSKEADNQSAPEKDVPGKNKGASVVDWLKGVPDDQESRTPIKDILSSTLEKLQIRHHISIGRAEFSPFMNDQANSQETSFKGTYKAFSVSFLLVVSRVLNSILNASRTARFLFLNLNCKKCFPTDFCPRIEL